MGINGITGRSIYESTAAEILAEIIPSFNMENHLAMVYDTKIEFDHTNKSAVRYVAAVAIAKVFHIGNSELNEYRPTDGSVCNVNAEFSENENISRSIEYRLMKERNTREEKGMVYVPNSDKYCESMYRALSQVDKKDPMFMSAEELTQHNRREKLIRLLNPQTIIAITIIFWLFFFLYILFISSQ